MKLLAKDFIETAEGLIFAVVESGLEDRKVLCFLRYIKINNVWQKINTKDANQLLNDNYPQYLYFSKLKNVLLHAVNTEDIEQHHLPKLRLKKIIKSNNPIDEVEDDLITLCRLFEQHGVNLDKVGVTGSILISAQNPSSDIDLVFYCMNAFHKARQLIPELIILNKIKELSENDWISSFKRRGCELSYDEYLWHEKRKYNKAIINQRKFDVSFVSDSININQVERFQKLDKIKTELLVTDDCHGFDYPAKFYVDHPTINSIISYTATYTGQAQVGEWVEVSGVLEQFSQNEQCIVVGSSREANGEYIRVIDEK